MQKVWPYWMTTLLLVLWGGLALADSPDEAKLSAKVLAQSVVGFLQAEPPNLEMAGDRLKDAIDKGEGVNTRLLKLAQQALQAGVPQAVPPLIAKAVGEDPGQFSSGPLVEVKLGSGVFWAFGIGSVLIFLGAYGLGRRSMASASGGR